MPACFFVLVAMREVNHSLVQERMDFTIRPAVIQKAARMKRESWNVVFDLYTKNTQSSIFPCASSERDFRKEERAKESRSL